MREVEVPASPHPDFPPPPSREPRFHLPPWSALLEHFYTQRLQPLPRLHLLAGDQVPEPYKGLLVHSSDMTPMLEAFYRSRIGLTVLSREIQKESYLREVVLFRETDARPVEYGAIRIFLEHLPPVGRRCVLKEERPLGNILQGESIPHLSWPQAFFQAASDAHLESALGLQQPGLLYGRRNVLLDASRRLLAEVIEVLSPVA